MKNKERGKKERGVWKEKGGKVEFVKGKDKRRVERKGKKNEKVVRERI